MSHSNPDICVSVAEDTSGNGYLVARAGHDIDFQIILLAKINSSEELDFQNLFLGNCTKFSSVLQSFCKMKSVNSGFTSNRRHLLLQKYLTLRNNIDFAR